MKKQTHEPKPNNDLEAYEYGQALIRKMLRQVEDGLERHDHNSSGKPGGHNSVDVQNLQDVVGKLIEIKGLLAKINR